MIKKIFTTILALFATHSNSIDSTSNFYPDQNVAKMTEAYSLDCVDSAKQNFKLTLDFSDESVLKLEPLLENLSQAVKSGKIPQDNIDQFAKMFGFYVGESYIRN